MTLDVPSRFHQYPVQQTWTNNGIKLYGSSGSKIIWKALCNHVCSVVLSWFSSFWELPQPMSHCFSCWGVWSICSSPTIPWDRGAWGCWNLLWDNLLQRDPVCFSSQGHIDQSGQAYEHGTSWHMKPEADLDHVLDMTRFTTWIITHNYHNDMIVCITLLWPDHQCFSWNTFWLIAPHRSVLRCVATETFLGCAKVDQCLKWQATGKRIDQLVSFAPLPIAVQRLQCLQSTTQNE